MALSIALKKRDASSNFTQMHRYQRTTAGHIIHYPTRAIVLAPGLGKSLCTLEAFYVLRNHSVVSNMFVVAPKRVCYNVWPNEIEKWGYDFTYTVLHGSKKDERWQEVYDIYIVNYDGMEWLYTRIYEDNFLPDMLVLDESTKIKGHKSNRTAYLHELSQHVQRRYILTGYPAPNGYHDLWSQYYFLDQGRALGRYITHYRRRWFDQVGEKKHGRFRIQDEEAKKEIWGVLKPQTTHFPKDTLPLPKLVENPVMVRLEEAAWKLYRKFKRECVIEIEKKKITAVNAGVLSNKLRQVANGGIYHEDKREGYEDIHYEKTDAVVEIVESVGEAKVLIGYEFHHDAARLIEALEENYDIGVIGGMVHPKEEQRTLAMWNRGEIQIMLAQIASVAHGLNLQENCAHVIFHSLVFSLDNYRQFIERVWRQGQTKTVIAHLVIAMGTVDERVLAVLRDKQATEDELLDALVTHLYE